MMFNDASYRVFYAALSTWIPKDRFCFSLAMDIEPNQLGTLEDLMLSSFMIWILHFSFWTLLYTTPELPWILPLDPDLDLYWTNRFSTFSAFALDRFRPWIILVLALRLYGVWLTPVSGFMDLSMHPGQLQ